MTYRLKPMSIRLPIAALLLIAILSMLSGASSLWSDMSPGFRSATALIVLSMSALAVAALFFVQARGIASLLPYRMQGYLVNQSIMGLFQGWWRVTGDVFDAAVVIGMTMDCNQTEQILARLSPQIRKTITQPGIINLIPSPLSELILPSHVRQNIMRSRDLLPNLDIRSEQNREEQVLRPIVIDVTRRRIGALIQTIVLESFSNNPLFCLLKTHFQVLMTIMALLSLLKASRSPNVRRMIFRFFQVAVFVSALSINFNAVISRIRRFHQNRPTHSNIPPNTRIRNRSYPMPSAKIIIAGSSVLATAAIYLRYRGSRRV